MESFSEDKGILVADTGDIYEVSELFKVCGDFTRMSILYTLTGRELCVCDIADTLNMSSSAISHQLRILKHTKLVSSRRDGKSIYYKLADNHIEEIFETALEHIKEERG